MKIEINNREARCIESDLLVSGNRKTYQVTFEVSGDIWQNDIYIGVFQNGDTWSYSLVEDNVCVIPQMVLAHTGTLRVGLQAVDKSGATVNSEMCYCGKIEQGAQMKGGDVCECL
jgi:hypothetical protein